MLDPVVLQVRDDIAIDPNGTSFTSLGETYSGDSERELRHNLRTYIYRRWHGDGTRMSPTAGKEDLHDEGNYKRVWDATDQPIAHHEVPCHEGPLCGVVYLQGVRVRLPLRDACISQGVHLIGIPKLRPYISPGFIYYSHKPLDEPSIAWRVYINLKDPVSGAGIWSKLISDLPAAGVDNFHAKIGATHLMIERRDSLVVYLESWTPELRSVFESLPELGAVNYDTSAITLRIAPGVSLGQEPKPSPEFRGMSFGQHRSHVLADALVHSQGLPEVMALATIAETLQSSGINPRMIYLNTEESF